MRSVIHAARARDWHWGQCRFRHELYQTRVWPHRSHCSTCPPRAAVRHCSIACITRRWAVESAPAIWSRNVTPYRRNTSARGAATDPSPRPPTQAGAEAPPGWGSRSNGLVVPHTRVVASRRISCRGREAAMAEQQLNGAHVGPGFEQVHGKRVPQRVRGNRFREAGSPPRLPARLRHGVRADVPVRSGARKQPVAGSCHPPPCPELGRATWARASRSGPAALSPARRARPGVDYR